MALDLLRFYRLDLTPREMRRMTWQRLRALALSLLDLPDSLTRKEATRGV